MINAKILKCAAIILAISMGATSFAANLPKKTAGEQAEKVVVKHFQNNGKDYFLRLVTIQSFYVENGQDVDAITLKATFNDSKKTLWTINDRVTCPGLDISGEFLPAATTFNAIKPHNGDDNNIEVTIGYKMFCGGGIDPKILKIIYHDNTKKFALRGETAIAYEGNESKPTGGKYNMDSEFKKAPISIQNHLKNLWSKVSVEHETAMQSSSEIKR